MSENNCNEICYNTLMTRNGKRIITLVDQGEAKRGKEENIGFNKQVEMNPVGKMAVENMYK